MTRWRIAGTKLRGTGGYNQDHMITSLKREANPFFSAGGQKMNPPGFLGRPSRFSGAVLSKKNQGVKNIRKDLEKAGPNQWRSFPV